MAQTVFNRIEKKYLLTEDACRVLLSRLPRTMWEDQFARSTILNIYYDTPDFLLVRRSLSKPKYKEKLRLRSYGVPGMDSTVFLEIKKKYRGNVNKRREPLTLREAYAFLHDGVRPARDGQILRELEFFLTRYPSLGPRIFLAYDRLALADQTGSGFRLTFDRRIRYRTIETGLERGDGGTLLLPEGWVLMESKLPGAAPLWFAKLLSELQIRQTSFSKVGTAYETLCGSEMLPRQLSRIADQQSAAETKGVLFAC